jgi:hypothetical protein
MSLRSRAADFMNRATAQAAGVTISYTRLAGGTAVTITDAVAGRSSQVSTTGPGDIKSRVDFTERDYLIPVASLIQNGTAFEPIEGDRVEETINGTLYRFEVKPADNLKAWDWSDTGRTRVRIRTKRVKVT